MKNYITSDGFNSLRSELKELIEIERPQVVNTVHWAAKNGDRSENGDYIYGKRRLREIDKRCRFLTKAIETAEIVDPTLQTNLNRVFFGATVTYWIEQEDREQQVKIVGQDEIDVSKKHISWTSPVAKALLGKFLEDEVEVVTPDGNQTLVITTISYR